MAVITDDPPATAGDPPPPSEVLGDRISDLPEPLLLTIVSFLPIHLAAQTSLLSRRFRKLWCASPSLYFDRSCFSVTPKFVKMVDGAILGRDCSAPVERLHIKSRYDSRCLLPLKSVARWIHSTDLMGVRHLRLTLEAATVAAVCCFIFSIKSLESLHISTLHLRGHRALMPTSISCTRLKNLYIWLDMDSADLTKLIGGLPVLEDLELRGIDQNTIDISSLSVKTLKLQCNSSKIKLCFPNLDFMYLLCKLRGMEKFQGEMPLVSKAEYILNSPVEESMLVLGSILKSVPNVVKLRLSIETRMEFEKTYLRCSKMQVPLPKLEDLNLSCSTCYLKMFQVEMPLLRKAEIYLSDVREDFVPPITGLLKCIENVVDLKLTIWDHWAQLKPFHVLESNKKPPLFPHLINFDLFTCCHEATIGDVISLLENSPVLNCLKMTHKDPCIDWNQDKKKVYWQSKLPRNSKGNYQHACFTDLHFGDQKSQIIKLLSRRLVSKKRKI